MTAQQDRRWRSSKANDYNQGGEKQRREVDDDNDVNDNNGTHTKESSFGGNKDFPFLVKTQSGCLVIVFIIQFLLCLLLWLITLLDFH